MKYLITTIAAVMLVGCTKRDLELGVGKGIFTIIVMGICGLICWMNNEHNDHKK